MAAWRRILPVQLRNGQGELRGRLAGRLAGSGDGSNSEQKERVNDLQAPPMTGVYSRRRGFCLRIGAFAQAAGYFSASADDSGTTTVRVLDLTVTLLSGSAEALSRYVPGLDASGLGSVSLLTVIS